MENLIWLFLDWKYGLYAKKKGESEMLSPLGNKEKKNVLGLFLPNIIVSNSFWVQKGHKQFKSECII